MCIVLQCITRSHYGPDRSTDCMQQQQKISRGQGKIYTYFKISQKKRFATFAEKYINALSEMDRYCVLKNKTGLPPKKSLPVKKRKEKEDRKIKLLFAQEGDKAWLVEQRHQLYSYY